MEKGVIILTISAYGIAWILWWRDGSPAYLIALIAGQCGSLLSPLWQSLYGFVYDQRLPILYTFLGNTLPRPIFLAAWSIMVPPLAIFFLFRHRWWFAGYTTSLITLILFVLYHLLIEVVGVRAGWWCYTGQSALPFMASQSPNAPELCTATTLLGVPLTVLSASMNGLISLGLLSVLLLTQRYAWSSLILILTPMPVLLSLFVYGLLGAPLYTALLLGAQSWANALGLVGTLGLLLWGAHIIATSLHQQRNWRQTI